MKSFIFFLFIIYQFSAIAQQPNADAERMLQALKQSGLVRQEGNHIIFKVKKASDTAQLRLLYGNMFASDKWTMGFEVEGKPITKPVIQPVTNEVNNRVTTNTTPVNQPINRTDNSCSCFSNMQVFNYENNFANKDNPPFTEHIFTVPEGISKIKIEAWSAGGDGWSNSFDANADPENTQIALKGGGGGGGAFIFVVLSVKPGDKVNMKVPAGGSNHPLTIQLNDRFTGGLVLISGSNARETPVSENFNGKGGKLGAHTGAFASGIVSINGEDGAPSYVASNYQDQASRNGYIEMDWYDTFFGAGGTAPRGGSGGAGMIIKKTIAAGSYAGRYIPAKNGIFPGGGGGAGLSHTEATDAEDLLRHGKGAHGLIIIYY